MKQKNSICKKGIPIGVGMPFFVALISVLCQESEAFSPYDISEKQTIKV